MRELLALPDDRFIEEATRDPLDREDQKLIVGLVKRIALMENCTPEEAIRIALGHSPDDFKLVMRSVELGIIKFDDE